MRLLAAILLVLVHLTRVRTGLLNTEMLLDVGRHREVLSRSLLCPAGPYNLKLDRYELCDDLGTAETVIDWWMVKKSTHKTFLHGPIYIPYDYDDTLQAVYNFSRFGSRGWGQNAYIQRDYQFCSKFKTNIPAMFDFYFKSWGIEKPSCPIKAGNYTMDLDTDLPRLARLPFLPYGTYKLALSIFRGNPPVKYSCIIYYITCSERPR